MTGKNLVKKIAFGTAVMASLLGGVNAYAQETKKPEVIATLESTYEYPSNRQDKNKGKIHTYNFLSDGTIYRLDNPKVKFSQRWFWDVDGDGEFGTAEEKAIKEGKIVYMHPKFNELASNEMKKVLENKVQDSGLTSKVRESNKGKYYSQDLSGRDKDEKPTAQSPSYPVNPSEENAKKERRDALKQIQDKEMTLPEPEMSSEKRKSSVYPILGINYSGIKNSAGIDAGIRFGRESNPFNLAILGSYQKGFSEDSDKDVKPTSPAGRWGQIITETSDYQSWGFDVVGYLGKGNIKFLLGLGPHWSTEEEKTTVQAFKKDRLENSNRDDDDELLDKKLRIFAGGDFKTGDYFRTEINGGFEKDSQYTKPFVAIKTTFVPPIKHKRK